MPKNSQPDHLTPSDTTEPLSEIRLDLFTTPLPPADHRMLKNLALVLTARGIPCWQIPTKKPQQLLVQSSDIEAAEHEISLYLHENKVQPPPLERFNRQEDNTRQTVCILLLIGIFHNMTYLNLSGFGYTPIDWLQLGRADADLIRAGEWWRTITALTLHADAQHLIGNLLIGGYFVIRLCRLLGGGVGWNLILWSGILGNGINALMHTSGHRSIGASTALFGAIGAAGMIGLMRRQQSNSRYAILPVAAATGLLAMLGAGTADTATDIGAHLFGFACGLVLGGISGRWVLQHGLPTPWANKILATAALLTPVCAWLLALTVRQTI
jgi:membrane associated rhomboid family serine protease